MYITSMAAPFLITIAAVFFSVLLFGPYFIKKKLCLPLLISVIINKHRIHDRISEILQSLDHTFIIRSTLLSFKFMLTSDPLNVHHITNTNFSMYPKGSEWRKRFDVFGYTVFNSDFEEWSHHRKDIRTFLNYREFQPTITRITRDGITKGLIRFLDCVSEQNLEVDLQDIFQRLIYDISFVLATGYESESIGIGIPKPSVLEALDDAADAILQRFILPERVWRLQKWLGIGKERKLRQAWETIDRVMGDVISKKQEEIKDIDSQAPPTVADVSFSWLGVYLNYNEFFGSNQIVTCQMLKDNVLGLIFATVDTTTTAISWFFWLLSQNPHVESKIRGEILRQVNAANLQGSSGFVETEQLNKMVYLHAALCETLRLFPPVPCECRVPTKPDTLPSGHEVDQKTFVMISTYAMGRMKTVWGDDCNDFKPERWITKEGSIKYEPPNKFFAFNGGPRNCIGKDLGFTLMKTVAANIIHNFGIHLVKDQPPVTYYPSIILRMKHGLTVKVSRRSASENLPKDNPDY